MAAVISLAQLQPEDSGFLATAAFVAQSLQKDRLALLRLEQQDVHKVETTQAVLREKAVEWDHDLNELVLYPSKQHPGRSVYEYSLGQDVRELPRVLQKTAPQVQTVMMLPVLLTEVACLDKLSNSSAAGVSNSEQGSQTCACSLS